MDFGQQLKTIRQQKKLSQKDLAAKIKATNTSVSNWENGISRPSSSVVLLIAKALNINPFELIGDYNLNDVEELQKKEKSELSYEENLALEFAKDATKEFSKSMEDVSERFKIMNQNLKELFSDVGQRITESMKGFTVSIPDFSEISRNITQSMYQWQLSNGGETFVMSYHCLNKKGKALLCDYICGLLKVSEFINHKDRVSEKTTKSVSKRLQKFKKENLEIEKSEEETKNGNDN